MANIKLIAFLMIVMSVRSSLAVSVKEQQSGSSKSDMAAFESLFNRAGISSLISSASVLKESAARTPTPTPTPTRTPALKNLDMTAVAAAPAAKGSASVATNPTLTNLDMTAVAAPAPASSAPRPVNRANQMYLVAQADGTLAMSHLVLGLLLAGCVLVTAAVTLVATIMTNGCKCGKNKAETSGAPADPRRAGFQPVQNSDSTYVY